MIKKCSKCWIDKPLTDFYKRLAAHSPCCKECQNKSNTIWRKNNPERRALEARRYKAKYPSKGAEAQRKWSVNNPDKLLAQKRAYRARNMERLRKYLKVWHLKNKERRSARESERRKLFPEIFAAKSASQRCGRAQARVSWANKFFIEEAYDLAKRRTALKTGGIDEWQVDHIVPITSPIVCGLHVEHNLQVIPAKENYAKRNRYWPDMP